MVKMRCDDCGEKFNFEKEALGEYCPSPVCRGSLKRYKEVQFVNLLKPYSLCNEIGLEGFFYKKSKVKIIYKTIARVKLNIAKLNYFVLEENRMYQ